MLFPSVRFRLEVAEECGSTNEVLLSERGEPGFHGRALLALRQTAGHGRRGRSWDSGEGNLALTVALTLTGDPARIPLLGFVAGLALFEETLAHLPAGADLRLKWPNDLYLNGQKLAGMLAQGRQGPGATDVVFGVGMNLKHAPAGLAGSATSLADAGGNVPSPEVFAESFLRRLEGVLAVARDFAWLRKEWEPRARLGDGPLFILGEPGSVRPLQLLPSGELLVETPDGAQRALASENVSLRFEAPV